MEILLCVCAVLVALSQVSAVVDRWLRPRRLEDDALADWIKGIERNVAMMRGRLNRIAPPRLGTGTEEDTGQSENVAPAASQGPPSVSRSAVLTAWRKRRGL